MLLLFSVLALNQASICPSRTLAVIIIFTSVTFDTGSKGRQVCLAPPPVIVTMFMSSLSASEIQELILNEQHVWLERVLTTFSQRNVNAIGRIWHFRESWASR